jgi:hypothetical protein
MSQIQTIGTAQLEQAFGETLSPWLQQRIAEYDLQCRCMDQAERDSWLLKIIQTLLAGDAVAAGAHRHKAWEAGWAENLERFKTTPVPESLIPGYFGKYPAVRWMRDLVVPVSPQFEYRSLAVIQDWLFEHYLRDTEAVYEFGCGTGHNLFRMRAVNPHARLYGLDWSSPSQAILSAVQQSGLDSGMSGINFNMFHPDTTLSLQPGACAVTVASLEQTGDQFEPFLAYLLSQPIKRCIHIEPIGELLDPGHLLDGLSLAYFRMRNYLNGYLERLRELEQAGRIRIVRAQRSNIGSLYIDGYSVIVWEPAHNQDSSERE